jgi:hypothetical protein
MPLQGYPFRHTHSRSSTARRKKTRTSLLREKINRRNLSTRSRKRRASRKTTRSGKKMRSRTRTVSKKTKHTSNTRRKRRRPNGQDHARGKSGGRIPEDRYRANFGRDHRFRVTEANYRDRHFQYGGYSFGFIDAWPSKWLYTQDVYVIEIDGMYYLCNPVYPGVNIALSLIMGAGPVSGARNFFSSICGNPRELARWLVW